MLLFVLLGVGDWVMGTEGIGYVVCLDIDRMVAFT
jgi:Ni,Fe-hydrogenase maturation factor